MSATTPAQEPDLLDALAAWASDLAAWAKPGLAETEYQIGASSASALIAILGTAGAEIERLRDARAAVIEELEKEARECADQLQLLAKDQTKLNPFSRAVYDKLDALRALANRSALPR